MADPILDRESEITEEEKQHRQQMAERMRALLAGEDLPKESTVPEGAYAYTGSGSTLRSDHVPAYQPEGYSSNEYHAPVVPNSPDAPSARKRFDDYIPVTVGMKSLQRMGDMPARSVTDYAPVSQPEYEPYSPAKEEEATHTGLFETLLYKNGELVDTATLAPEAPSYEPAQAPAYEPSKAPSYEPAQAPSYESYENYEQASAPELAPSYAPTQAAEEEEDATPTRRTMSHRNVAEEQHNSSKLLTALSFRTKMVLLAVAAVIILLLAVVCINTAIINSIDEGVEARQEQLASLTRQLDDINAEITDLTSPENIERWALEHNMTR